MFAHDIAVVAALALLACSPDRTPEGGACKQEESFRCANGLTCYYGTCEKRKGSGAKCNPKLQSYEAHCDYSLTCSEAGVCETKQEREAREVKERALQETKMLEDSKIEPERIAAEATPSAEQATEPAGPGLRVRVARTRVAKAKLVFASCRRDERLIGGGCKTQWNGGISSYPSHAGSDDTVGARWVCEQANEMTIEAYALCQSLEAAQ